jgi:hypothetical protein
VGRAKDEHSVPVDDLDALVEALLAENPVGKYGGLYGVELGDTATGPKLLALDRAAQAVVVNRLMDRLAEYDRQLERLHPRAIQRPSLELAPEWRRGGVPRQIAVLAMRELLRRKLPLTDETILTMVSFLRATSNLGSDWIPIVGITAGLVSHAENGPVRDDLIRGLESVVEHIRKDSIDPAIRKAADRLSRLIDKEPTARINPGEAWSDAALADLDSMEAGRRRAWAALLASCQIIGGRKPSAKARKEIQPLLDAVGRTEFKSRLLRWFPLVDKPKTRNTPHRTQFELQRDNSIEPPHVDLLKGLSWCAGFEADRELARALSALALSAYRKIPFTGPRVPALGNAAIAALGAVQGLDSVFQLAYLKAKVKSNAAQKEIEKALTAAAQREGLPRDEVDELAVPAYGMEQVGHRREVLGDFVAEIVVDGSDAEIRWSKTADGKALKSIPAAVKKDHAADVKELQAAVKDVGKMLSAQRDRIDGLFLARKSWPLAAWRERYLDHPLVGTMARRLLWHFETDGKVADGIWLDGRLVGVDDQPIEGLSEATSVALWHPIGQPIEEITDWRDWLDRHEVRQPFKQAHREVYVLTDAERATRVYSNRFSAHILRQHQYHALCAARGWRNRLRLMVDASYPPTSKDLPEWGLRAEFWVEGIGDDYNRDLSGSGAYLYLSTDQVRFYEIGAAQRQAHASGGGYAPGWNRADAEPVPIESVPPLVLSEVLRDVDLFVGVASVGNDPAWADGGPGGRHVDYWNRYSFGDLSATGRTRKAVLERLIPRLKIAPRCTFSDKFLCVRGDLRGYKIHLGSGNILVEPNDQYLCIVAQRGASLPSTRDVVFLPFEGDNTLSIILSKALMLADDTKITDPTITSQIRR